MTLNEAFESLKSVIPILRPLPNESGFWKKVVLDLFSKGVEGDDVYKALLTVAASIEDREVIDKYFEIFGKETNDGNRRYMIEALAPNMHESVVEHQLAIMGIRNSSFDRYVRQAASQNIIAVLKSYLNTKPVKLNYFTTKLKTTCLNDANTFVRMNTAIILRNVGDRRVVPEIQKRIEAEKKLEKEMPGDIGIPYVIRELERTAMALKERA